jgi:hypothetical protein
VRDSLSALIACALFWSVLAGAHAQSSGVEIAQLETHRNGDAVELSANLRFDLSTTMQDALYKGVPLIFIMEVDIYRERWYWLDRRVGSAQRQYRLTYHPLTRRWRMTAGGGDVAFAQTFDTLADVLAVVRRVSSWRIADATDIETSSNQRLEFRFRLDTTQLPRPLQIGALGQSDWALSAAVTKRLVLEPAK